jgi:hypothetical protein
LRSFADDDDSDVADMFPDGQSNIPVCGSSVSLY